MKKTVLAVLLLISFSLNLSAGEWYLGDSGCSAFLPEGWTIFSREDRDRISFISPEGDVIYQVSVYPGDLYASDTLMMEDHLAGLTILEADQSQFLYRGRSCSLADLTLDSEGIPVRGWFLFIDREDYDYYLTAITSPDNYERALPLILSCLDGFSPDEESRKQPGAVSTLIRSAGGSDRRDVLEFPLGALEYTWNDVTEEAGRLLIEREAAILSGYNTPEVFDEAWKRYYQLIYRNSAGDLDDLARQLERVLSDLDDTEKAKILLQWLQDFEYGSTDRFSDLMTSTESLLARTGDCDSLAIIYITLLNKMGVPSLLMVSREFSHAMAAVAVPAEGAGFSFENQRFVVAEMTKNVALGQIAAEMADISKWVIIPFEGYNQGQLALGE
ncbi:MAG: hypothetical protein PQJ58_00155 [Spirochaetales bacterium]|nr:hypothetical protein [Spirochaetales bacterium]